MNTSKNNLKILASLVWYSGIFVLYFKSYKMLNVAIGLNSTESYIWLAIFSGIIIGMIKTKYLFRKLCIKNLNRIEALENPKLWQFYRPQFFMFLLSMIMLGSYLSRIAADSYAVLITMSIIEISIATALAGSSPCFWNKQILEQN